MFTPALNRRAPDVVSRNEVGRLPLKLHVYMRMLKFWTHLENLSDNSIAKQCLQLSAQLAEHKKPTFIFSLREILQQYGCMNQNQDQFIDTTMDYNAQKIKNHLPKIKQTIMSSLKIISTTRFDLIRNYNFILSLRLIKEAPYS